MDDGGRTTESIMNRDKSQKIKGRIVIFDDEPNMGRILVKTLGMEGFEARAFTNPIEGLDALDELDDLEEIDAVETDS